MKKPSQGSGSGRKATPEDDHALWQAAASSVRPLARKSRVHAGIERDGAGSGVTPAPKPRHQAAHHPAHAPSPIATTKAPPLADFDPRHAKKLRSGRLEIERRIDLHGMRQAQAHSALRRFLFQCHAEGMRRVLVITGKGAPRRRADDGDSGGWSADEPGVLKRQVPRWLVEPEMRSIVVSYTAAAIQHGGEGALYVHLRRRDRVD